MKKTLALFCFLAIGFSFSTFGQGSGTSILPFNEGKILSGDNISFLQLIKGQAGQANSRGGVSGQVIIGSDKLSVGTKISKAQAETISQAIQEHGKSNEATVTKDSSGPKARGDNAAYCGYCCYYYYWDYNCSCYLYYWYYCCACY